MTSRFPEAKKGARDAFEHAIGKALDVGEAEAEKRLERIDDTKGYDLPIDVGQEQSQLSGRIEYEPFYGRWFEYGTVYIPASPFIGPAHRKMRKTFKDYVGDEFEPWVRKRTGWR
jgi:hypothetical protein